MNITEIKIKKLEDNYVKALVSITIENSLVITGLKLIQSKKNELFLAMPNRKNANGEFKDIVFPITAEFRNELTTKILGEYKKDETVSSDFKPTILPDDELPF